MNHGGILNNLDDNLIKEYTEDGVITSSKDMIAIIQDELKRI